MITLLTGLPGNGKGVYGLDWLVKKVTKENADLAAKGKPERVVYYSGINECKIPGWVELENPLEWYKVPPGSYVLLDECQRYFRTRANGAHVPPHVSELETHRHHGLDLLLITQHPMLIDQNIRRLVNQHFHIVRKFGREAAVVHEWLEVNEQPTKSRRGSIRHEYKYNKEVYGWYKSAELHTVKRNLPLRYYLIFIAPVVAIGLLYFLYLRLNPENVAARVAEINGVGQQVEEGELERRSPVAAAAPELTWYEQQAPRVPALPATAPKYDDVVKPVRAPRPAACVLMRGECRCYTQQATRMNTEDAVCRQIVENGYFLDYDDQPLPKDNNPPQIQTTQQTVLQPEALQGSSQGETVGPAPVGVPAEPEVRSPSKVARDRMASSSYAFKYPGAIAD